jgi:hypothetical protein
MWRAILRRRRGEADAKTEYVGEADKTENIVPVNSLRRQKGHRMKSVLHIRSNGIDCHLTVLEHRMVELAATIG